MQVAESHKPFCLVKNIKIWCKQKNMIPLYYQVTLEWGLTFTLHKFAHSSPDLGLV